MTPTPAPTASNSPIYDKARELRQKFNVDHYEMAMVGIAAAELVVDHIALEVMETVAGPNWWDRTARTQIIKRHFEIVAQPEGLYLLRIWLSPPVQRRPGKWESGNSRLLHFIRRADGDRHPHKHPWHFNTLCLSGGYTESIRFLDVTGKVRRHPRTLAVGETIDNNLDHVHRVEDVLPNTVTMVRTGPARDANDDDWGFYIDDGDTSEFVPWRTYLERFGLLGLHRRETA